MRPLSVISYFGGKAALVPYLNPILEWKIRDSKLDTYFEGFLGGGRMLLNLPKKLVNSRIGNDWSRGIYCLFHCLADKELSNALRSRLWKIQHSKEFFNIAKGRYWETSNQVGSKLYSDDVEDIVENAVFTYYLAFASRAANMTAYSTNMLSTNLERANFIKHANYSIPLAQYTLNGCQMECEDSVVLLKRYEHCSNMLAYLDIPYVMKSRRSNNKVYKCDCLDMAETDVQGFDVNKLVSVLHDTKASIMMSCYDNDVFKELEADGWRKYFICDKHVSSSGKAGTYSKEYIWTNFNIPYFLFKK